MLDQIPILVEEEKLLEAVYYLAFVEGALWPKGVYTLERIASFHLGSGFSPTPE